MTTYTHVGTLLRGLLRLAILGIFLLTVYCGGGFDRDSPNAAPLANPLFGGEADSVSNLIKSP